MEALSLLGLLGICSIEDVQKKQIHTIFALLVGILGMIYHIFNQRISIQNLLGGSLVGLLFLLISILSKERLGKGDAILFIVTGIYLGFWENLQLIFYAFLLAGLYAMILFVTGKKRCADTFPFVPFLLTAYIVELGIYGGLPCQNGFF